MATCNFRSPFFPFEILLRALALMVRRWTAFKSWPESRSKPVDEPIPPLLNLAFTEKPTCHHMRAEQHSLSFQETEGGTGPCHLRTRIGCPDCARDVRLAAQVLDLCLCLRRPHPSVCPPREVIELQEG